MTDVLVGCPLYRRDWIIGEWLTHVEDAARRARVVPGYIFAVDPRDPTVPIVDRFCERHERKLVHVWCEEPSLDRPDAHVWNPARYARMVYLRNELLAGVRKHAPVWFLSLDSDILLHADALTNLLETARERGFDAVATKVYLSETGRECPNYSMTRHPRGRGGFHRPDSEGVFRVDILMAATLMSPVAYGVDYEPHYYGEDIGWSLACGRNDVLLGWDGRVVSKHVMVRTELDAVDKRCGF